MESFNDKWRKMLDELEKKMDPFTVSETPVTVPHMYNLALIHDANIPADFLSGMVQKFFYKTPEDASLLLKDLPARGAIICGTYTREIAETKILEMNDFMKQHSCHLKCIIKKDENYVVRKS